MIATPSYSGIPLRMPEADPVPNYNRAPTQATSNTNLVRGVGQCRIWRLLASHPDR